MNLERKEKDKQRLLALDAARGLAVIGMLIQHFALNEFNASIVSGNTMILFILCSGISFSLMSQRMIEKGVETTEFRSKMLARAVFIDLIGYILIMLNGPFAVILPAYAVLFVLALIFYKRSTKTLIKISGVLFVVSPIIMIAGLSLFSNVSLLGDIAGGPLSGIALLPVFIAGMVIGRLDLHNIKVSLKIVSVGIVLLVTAKLISSLVLPNLIQGFETWLMKFPSIAEPQVDPVSAWPLNVNPPAWQMLLYSYPQCGSTFELMIGMGVSLIVLGLTCIIGEKSSIILKPFSTVGCAALTIYASHIVVGWFLAIAGIETGLDGILFGDVIVALITIIVSYLLSSLKMGPLESSMRHFDKLFSNI